MDSRMWPPGARHITCFETSCLVKNGFNGQALWTRNPLRKAGDSLCISHNPTFTNHPKIAFHIWIFKNENSDCGREVVSEFTKSLYPERGQTVEADRNKKALGREKKTCVCLLVVVLQMELIFLICFIPFPPPPIMEENHRSTVIQLLSCSLKFNLLWLKQCWGTVITSVFPPFPLALWAPELGENVKRQGNAQLFPATSGCICIFTFYLQSL